MASRLGQASSPGRVLEVLAVFGRLGLTSFGGPIAHLGYFRDEVVARRRWVDEATYADLVALCQFLPGPASSQVGMGLGILRAGLLGGLAAWVGFTLPSALAMALFAYGVATLGLGGPGSGADGGGWLRGLNVVVVAVVAQAVWGMARTLCPDRARATLAIVGAIAILAWPSDLGQQRSLAQVLVIAAAGLVGWRLLGKPDAPGLKPTPPVPSAKGKGESPAPPRVPVGQGLALACWALFFGLLVGLPLLRQVVPSPALALFDSFFRVGSLVFGGGHVVLPLLQAEVVPPGWLTDEQFVAGYGAAQAVPGPLFTFAAYLGALTRSGPSGWAGASLAVVAIFLPSFLLVIGALPFWAGLRSRPAFQSALRGINAGVVGLLLAALYEPIWTSAIRGPADVALGLAAFGLLVFWKLPPWLVVLLAAAGGRFLVPGSGFLVPSS